MYNAVATDIALAPKDDASTKAVGENVRRVSDALAPLDEQADVHRPMRGILTGVLLGALFWAALVALFVAL